MKYEWIDAYCLAKKGAEKDYKLEWDADRYMIRSKIFALQSGDKYGKPIISVKLEPLFGEMLRSQYKDIIAGYHMNKIHWNSLYLDGDVPDDTVMKMLDMSYQLVLKSLSKKEQQEIAAHQEGD